MGYNVITANEEQQKQILKHLELNPIKVTMTKDDEDDIGFISLTTFTGKKMSWQLRGRHSCFGEFVVGNGTNTRYDLYKIIPELQQRMDEISERARKKFEKGEDIMSGFEKKFDEIERRSEEFNFKTPDRVMKELAMWKYFCILFGITLLGLVVFIYLLVLEGKL